VRPVVTWLLALLALGPAAATFDHSAFDVLLRRHVKDGLVDYDAFRNDASFQTYLDALARADVAPLPEPERLAFWINTYNAYTIALINRHGERDSIRNINKTIGLSLKGPWREPIVRAAGQVLHLDNVEHDVIRKRFREPRIHFALVCAARGCPPLRSEAYTGARLEAQLADQAQAFLRRSPDRNRVDVATRTVYVSMIFEYYADDFGGSDAAIGRYIAQFYPPGPERQLLESGVFTLRKTEYDWTLNSQERAGRKR
jgi:Protein of unknown function, DUF547